MIWSNLDVIVRRTLLERSMPIHYYFEYLVHCSSAVRELSFDTLKIINTEFLPVNDYGSVDLPDDFVDELGVYCPANGSMQQLPKSFILNPLRQRNADGNFMPFENTNQQGISSDVFGLQFTWSWYWNINDWGETTGRYFGAPGGIQTGYQVFKERRQIQLSNEFIGSGIILQYISDGQRVDNATQIDTQAIACIQSYIDWKRNPGAAMKDAPEARTFYNEKRLLRARLNSLTIKDMQNIIRNNIFAAIKS